MPDLSEAAGTTGAERPETPQPLPPDAPSAEDPDAPIEPAEEADIDTAGSTAAAPERPELPVHKVLCMVAGCKAGATYRPTASGTGFFILERYGMDIETSLGAGPNGRPICPFDEHGEMTLADEQLPIEQAIEQVNARTAKPPRLPFPAPAFNYEAVFREIVEKRHEVADLERDYERKKESASKAKKALDEGNEALGQMIDDFEDRAQEREFEIQRRDRQAEEGHPEGTTLVRCTWEQQHADDPCPLCSTSTTVHERQEMVRLVGAEILPRDSQGHADQVVIFRTRFDVQETVDALGDGLIAGVHVATIAEWSPEERAAVREWATRQIAALPQWLDETPAVLGRPHIAAAVAEGAKVQTCVTCGSVIKQIDTLEEAYVFGARVRSDCAGAEIEPTHHYPERRKKQPAPRKHGVTKPAVDARPAKKPKKGKK